MDRREERTEPPKGEERPPTYEKPRVRDYGEIQPRLAFSPPPPPQ